MLNNCNHGKFIKQDLLKRVGVECQKLSINIKTLTGEKSEEILMVHNFPANICGSPRRLEVDISYRRFQDSSV